MTGTRLIGVALVAGLTVLLTGCGSGHRDAVREVAGRFYGAIAARDGAAACALLAPTTRSELEESSRQPCPKAVLGEGIPTVGDPTSVKVFGTMGQVRFSGETAFLSRFPFGWRVLAAACTPQRAHPYDCKVKGA